MSASQANQQLRGTAFQIKVRLLPSYHSAITDHSLRAAVPQILGAPGISFMEDGVWGDRELQA